MTSISLFSLLAGLLLPAGAVLAFSFTLFVSCEKQQMIRQRPKIYKRWLYGNVGAGQHAVRVRTPRKANRRK